MRGDVRRFLVGMLAGAGTVGTALFALRASGVDELGKFVAPPPLQPFAAPRAAAPTAYKSTRLGMQVAEMGSEAASWLEAADPATGNPYWYNAETLETSWTPPPSSAPPPPPPPEAAQPASASPPEAAGEEEGEAGPTGPSLERQLINLNKWLVGGIIDQEEWEAQSAAIKAQMPKGPIVDAASLARPFKTTTLKWGALIDTPIPQGWEERRDYERTSKLEPGSLVGVSRSDGSARFAQVVKKSGLFYEDYWTVVVSMKDDGTPNAKRVEAGVMLIRPTQAGLKPVLDAMPEIEVREEDIGEALSGSKDKGWFGSMFQAPVFEGGSAPVEMMEPAAMQAPPKAQVPAGIIPGQAPATPPKAQVPAGIIPGTAPQVPGASAPADAVPEATPPPSGKTSEWI